MVLMTGVQILKVLKILLLKILVHGKQYIGGGKAWAVPSEIEDDAISEVLRTGPSVLPDMKYVYFDSLGGVNGSRKVKIGRHTFGAET